MMIDMHDARALTALLLAARDGDAEAEARLLPFLYDQLRDRAMAMMRRESPAHTLQPTALVHEAYMRLVGSDMPEWQNRTHFLAVSAEVMRRVLVDHGRRRNRQKRGGDQTRVSLEVGLGLAVDHDADVLALEDVLEELSALNPRQARIIVYRFYGGMTVSEVADELGVSKRTVEAEWTMAKAWLKKALTAR